MQNKHNIIIVLTLIASALVSCKKEPGYTDPTGGDTSKIWGHVAYNDGAPATGVAVSDGFSWAVVDKDGYYVLTRNNDSKNVFVSLPSDAAVQTGGNMNLPVFYLKTSSTQREYDFTLVRQTPENKFRLIGIGDPQVTDETQVGYYRNETVADMKAYVQSHTDMPTYGITLGDNVGNKWELFSQIGSTMSISNAGFPIFQTIGNHDHEYDKHDASEETYIDARQYWKCPKSNLAAQRRYELVFGPVNYSFNRGKVHIISMDDIMHTGKESSLYCGGFYDWQWEWLERDLELMPEGYIPVLCLHMPFKEGFTNFSDKKTSHWTDALNIIGQYKGFVIGGHQHNHRWFDHKTDNGNVHEYVLGTACGAWWHGKICTDGTPNGYGIFEFDGTALTNEKYKGTRMDENFQIRMYIPSSGHAFKWTSKDGKTTTNFAWESFTDKTIFINVWNAYDDWDFTVYENGVQTKTFKGSEGYKKTMWDMWAKNWFYGTGKQVTSSTNYDGKYLHMFKIELNSKPVDGNVKVVAKDRYGNTYEQTKFQNFYVLPDIYRD